MSHLISHFFSLLINYLGGALLMICGLYHACMHACTMTNIFYSENLIKGSDDA